MNFCDLAGSERFGQKEINSKWEKTALIRESTKIN